MKSTISIIVPVYKVEPYLRDCLNSIIGQTYRNIEIIIVNDGSPDNCPAICDEYAQKDERVKVIHKENGGLSSARNAGLNIAKGDYICFVDNDDFIHPQYCEILLTGIQNTECSFCACKSFPFENESETKAFSTKLFEQKIFSRSTWIEYIKTTQMGVWNKIYRKDLFNNIRFYEGKIHEDIMFCADLSNIVSKEIITCDSVLYFARLRKNSICDTEFLKPDRVFAARYFIENCRREPELIHYSFAHAIGQPWYAVDAIYAKFKIKDNIQFLRDFKKLLNDYLDDFLSVSNLSNIQKFRLKLFSKSISLYAVNAYARLLRVYLYRLFKKDPYIKGHGI